MAMCENQKSKVSLNFIIRQLQVFNYRHHITAQCSFPYYISLTYLI